VKWGYISATSSKVGVQKVMLCAFQCKPRPSGVSLESPELENIPKVAWNRAELRVTHDAREAVSATISIWEWSGILFRPTSYKESVQKAFLCPFHWKPRQSGVSLESPGLENISQVPANPAEVGQNHGTLKAVSATPSVLKWSGALFRPTSSRLKKNYCVYFTANQGYQELV